MDPKHDTNAKVINAFIKILISEQKDAGTSDIMKTDFMNEAMLVYTKRKTEVDTLARTFENLNKKDPTKKVNYSARMSPRTKRKTFSGSGNINGYSKMTISKKDISSRFKMSNMNKTKGIIPANISNVNKSIRQKKPKLQASHNDSIASSKAKRGRGQRKSEFKTSKRTSAHRSLQRYKMGCHFQQHPDMDESPTKAGQIKGESLALQDSRNQDFKKSKSISHENELTQRFDTRNSHHYYSK